MKLKASENVFSICLLYHKMHLEREEGLERLGLFLNFVPWWAPHFPYQKYITSPLRLIVILQRNISDYQVIVLSSQKGQLRPALFLQEVKCHLFSDIGHDATLLSPPLELGETAWHARPNRCISIVSR